MNSTSIAFEKSAPNSEPGSPSNKKGKSPNTPKLADFIWLDGELIPFEKA